MSITLRRVRLAFPQLWEATAVEEGGELAFSAAALLPVDHPQIAEIEAAIDAAGLAKWKEKSKAIVAQLRAQDRTCLHNGDLKSEYDGYAGNYFINARNKAKPLVIGRMKEPLSRSDGKPYAGCYVNMSIEIWAQDHKKGGKRINASLRGVQFLEDGDAFAGGAPARPEEFPDLDVEEIA